MKFTSVSLMFTLFLISCNGNKKIGKPLENSTLATIHRDSFSISNLTNKPTQGGVKNIHSINYSDMIGVWATSADTNENATFQIYKDSIEYLDMESGNRFYRIALSNDTLQIFLEDYTITQRIIFLDRNLFITVDKGDTEKAYRRW